MNTTPAVKPEVKRDKIAVLASTIVRELASVRIRDIERTPTEPQEPPIVMTARLTQLVEAYAHARKAKDAAEKAIEKAGYRVSSACDSRGTVTLHHPYVNRTIEKDRAKKLNASRCNAVRELRTETLIDLVTLDPNKAKSVVSAFRNAIERI